MSDAWELIPEKKRLAEGITTFILFCENSVNEPAYFRSFQIPGRVKINVVEGQLSGFENIIKTLQYCEREGLLEINETNDVQYRIKPGTTKHVWSIFDRDVETDNPEKANIKKGMQFTFSIQAAQHAGLKVAWSNDVFELWILLHFEDIQPGLWQHRNYISERLTAILKGLPKPITSYVGNYCPFQF